MRCAPGWFVVLAGCFSKPAGPMVAPGDAGDAATEDVAVDGARLCTGQVFASASVIADINSAGPFEPTMTADQLELYFSFDPDPNAETYLYDIGRATRATIGEAFRVEPTPLPFNSPDIDQEPSITGDGLMITFTVRENGSHHAYYATRPSVTATWSSATLVPGLQTIEIGNLDLSGDGLVAYFPDPSTPSRLRRASRALRTDPFDVDAALLGDDRLFPSVSSDGLELFWNDSMGGIAYTTRADTTAPFPAATGTLAGGYDPDVLPDGLTLIGTANGGGIAVWTRTCAEP